MTRDGTAVVSVRAASDRLRRTAESQIAGVDGSRGFLALRVSDGGEAISQAMELRRWAGPGLSSGAAPPSIGVAGVNGDPLGVHARAAALAEAASPGRILIGPRIIANGDVPPWLSLREDEAARELGGFETAWSNDGAEVPGLPLPGALAASIDRPWPLLGRRAELDAIATCWHRVVEGGRGVHLVAGEMGSGKSRLVAEASREVHRAGGLVLHGSGGGAEDVPYAPFVEALAHLVDHGEGLLPPGFATSPFAGLLPGFGLTSGRRSGDRPGVERAALFGAAVQGFGELSQRTPVLLVVDDLHHLGTSSLRLLDHLARTAMPMRLMILATYRPTDIEPTEERAAAITGLREGPVASHVELAGLGWKETRGIAAAMNEESDEQTLDAAATAAERMTDGNPLFTSEILISYRDQGAGASIAAGDPLPKSLRVLIATRAHALGESVYEHLCTAAVAGRRFDPEIVAAALDLPASEIAESVAVGQRAGLVSAVPDERYLLFTHEATTNSLYEETELRWRGHLHRRLAEAIERRGRSDRDAAELARHWRRADPPDPAKAMRFSFIAGEQAQGRGDHDGAAQWFERALEMHDSFAGGDDAERCDILIGLGTAVRVSGEGRFREILLEAARLAIGLDDTDRLVAAALANNRGFNSAVGDFDRERVAILELSAERLTDRTDPRLALVIAQLALELTFSPQLERRRELAAEALEIARRSGDQRVLARVLICGVIATWGPGNAAQRVADAGRAVAISAAQDEQLDLFHGLLWQAAARVELGHLSEAARALLQQRRIAEQIGDRTASWLCECSTSLHAALHGNLAEADRSVHAALALAQESSQPDALPFFASQLSSIRWHQGRLPELAPVLAAALEQNPGLPSFRSLVCLAHALAGDHQAALDVLAVDVASDFSELPVDPTWIAATTTYAHAIAELGDRKAASALRGVIAPYSGALASTSISAWGLVDHALGRLSLVLGEREEGERLLAQAVTGYARMSAPVWRAQAELDLVRGLIGGGFGVDASRLERALTESARIAESHGAGLLAIDDRDQLPATVVAPVDHTEIDDRIAALDLTDRQSEVLTLVSLGCTNAEIAADLEISQSTVKRHLENISVRLGVRGRAALTALLLRG